MRRAALALLLCALVACAPAEPATNAWRPLKASTLARTEVAAARVGRFVYVMGGFERRSGETVAATERYDLRRDRWRRVADMPAGLNHAAAVAPPPSPQAASTRTAATGAARSRGTPSPAGAGSGGSARARSSSAGRARTTSRAWC